MMEVFEYYARCNIEINKKMIEIIIKSDKKPYDIQINGYFKTIGEILDHIFVGDIIWLNVFKQVRDSDIFVNSIFKKDMKWRERQFNRIDVFKEKRNELDELIIKYIREIKVEDLEKEIVRYTKTGLKLVKPFWKS